ncbi:MAG: alpha-E domain-containing protein, partial [Planctomycetes bacterium]|nr:alpha-E domain-containing protein [Planctomycetota bacterium]
PRNEASLRVTGRLARVLDGAELARLSQLDLHAFVDDLQLGIADLHGEVASTWFPPPIQVEEAA